MGTRRMQAAFNALEKRFGDMKSITDPSLSVTTSSSITRQGLLDLVSHKAAALHVKGFFPVSHCKEVADDLLESNAMNWMVSHGDSDLESSDVDAVGLPFNVATSSGREVEYFNNSLGQIRRWRKGLQMSPIDKLRLEMDEVWDYGCTLARKKDDPSKPYSAGIGRIMRPRTKFDPKRWTRGFAHVDELAVMSKDKGLFSANIYLKNPQCGGELHIWPVTYNSRWGFYRNASTLAWLLSQDPYGQQMLRDKLPTPLSIKIDEGDLVLLCTQRPHGVKGPIVGGPRVSIQTFIQYKIGEPFRLDS